jgi:hypothetical protein
VDVGVMLCLVVAVGGHWLARGREVTVILSVRWDDGWCGVGGRGAVGSDSVGGGEDQVVGVGVGVADAVLLAPIPGHHVRW